jgi:hypothetical protein
VKKEKKEREREKERAKERGRETEAICDSHSTQQDPQGLMRRLL